MCRVVMERERKRSEVLIYFADSGRRGKEKIMKEEDRNLLHKEEGNGEERRE